MSNAREGSVKSTKLLDSAKETTIPATFNLEGERVNLTLDSPRNLSPSWSKK
jgi:hypothetical protein